MGETITQDNTTTYESIVQKVFSGQYVPGDRLIERNLAKELGVSRVPVRESLAKMVAQGVLVAGENGRGVRMREYSEEEIRQLYEFREVLEGSVAAAAAKAATKSDLTRMEMICEQMEAEVGNFGSDRWAELDRKFHETIADAGRNERFSQALKTLLTECYYVFYVLQTRWVQTRPSEQEAAEAMRRNIKDHRDLLDLIQQGKAEEAREKASRTMLESSDRVIRRMIAGELET